MAAMAHAGVQDLLALLDSPKNWSGISSSMSSAILIPLWRSFVLSRFVGNVFHANSIYLTF